MRLRFHDLAAAALWAAIMALGTPAKAELDHDAKLVNLPDPLKPPSTDF